MDTLSQQVEKLETQHDELGSLTGEIIATLELNMQRGHLRFQNEENDSEIFRKFISQWREKYRMLVS
jgi:hypothetical protein